MKAICKCVVIRYQCNKYYIVVFLIIFCISILSCADLNPESDNEEACKCCLPCSRYYYIGSIDGKNRIIINNYHDKENICTIESTPYSLEIGYHTIIGTVKILHSNKRGEYSYTIDLDESYQEDLRKEKCSDILLFENSTELSQNIVDVGEQFCIYDEILVHPQCATY